MMKKKLQVFISSTYKDLVEERQVAVLSILSSGHIPAGMELFTAGDESQWNVIKRWIEESDVFLLILGGRYGSIEPKTGKSYTQLEYEYAIELNKPFFAIVMTNDALEEKVKKNGSSVFETESPKELKSFKELVLSKMVKFFSDQKDIKLAIYETMADFSIRKDLNGWVRSNNSINSDQVAQQLSSLSEENQQLRNKLETLNQQTISNQQLYNGLTFEEIISVLSSKQIPKSKLSKDQNAILENIREKINSKKQTLLVFVLAYLDKLANSNIDNFEKSASLELRTLGLVAGNGTKFVFTVEGRKLYLKLLLKYFEVL